MKTGKKHIILYVVLLLLVLVSCSDRRTVIGVSQCSDDIWRQKVNREIKIGQYQYKNVDVVFASADNNGQRQARQIDSLVKSKVDLLVVAPSDVKTVAPAIERAYRAGIPFVILRAISDKADDSAEMDYPTFERIAAHRCASVTRRVARSLAGKQ